MKSQILTEKYLFPKTHSRNFDTCCEKVLDAPGITNDINANILSFNENLAVGLCSKLFILAPLTGNISTIIEKGNKLITSVKWKKGSNILVFSNSKKNIKVYDPMSLTFTKFSVSGFSYAQYFVGNMIVSGFHTGSIEFMDIRGPKSRLIKKHAHKGGVTGIDLSDSDHIASVGQDQFLRLWDIRTEKPYFSYSLNGPLKSVRWHPSNPDMLAVGSSALNILNQTTLYSFSTTGPVVNLEWNNAGTELVGTIKKSLKVWNFKGIEKISLEEHCEDVYFLCKSNEDQVVTGGQDETLRFWNILKSN